ncbi:MAG: hypothetical protein KTR15_11555 [Phycisphaeraceae bacterium]|nr:hypothetical protein [Phycisphaeraceae bacterium]
MQAALSRPTKQLSNPLSLKRIDAMSYIAYEYEMQEVAFRLRRHGYRGAICGPKGSGKSVMIQALGDELMRHGLSPLPLGLGEGKHKALPTEWRRTIRKARPADALLLDGYDLLPAWARAWVWLASRRAGAVVVTSHHDVRFKTLARPKPTAALLQRLGEQLHYAAHSAIDYDTALKRSKGDLRQALRLICQQEADARTRNTDKRCAG